MLIFLGQLGKECRVSKTGSKILEVLWELAHSNDLPCHLIGRALEEHLNVLTEIPNKEQLRKSYVLRSIDDIKKGHQVCTISQHIFIVMDLMEKCFTPGYTSPT